MAKKGKTTRSTVRSKRKPNNPREALAWLYTIADHIGETVKAYLAHKPPVPVADDGVETYAAARVSATSGFPICGGSDGLSMR